MPLVGIGLFYRRGYFRQRLDDERPAGRALPAQRHEPAAARARADGADRRARGRQRRARAGAARRLARAGRARLALPARHEDRGQPDVGARRHRHPLRRRPREPAAAGARARRRRRPRAAPARPRADGLPHERGPLRVPPARAHARARRGAGPVDRDEALERLRASTVFTTHTPVPAGNEVFDAGARAAEPRRRSSSAAASRGTSSPRSARSSPSDDALRADAVRAAHVAVRERRLGAARRRLARDVARALARAARRRGADHVDHERRPPADVDLAASSRRCSATRTRSSSARDELPARELWAAHRGAKRRLLELHRRDARRARARPRRRSRSASRAGSPPTSARASSSADPSGSRSSSPTPSARSRCSSPARRTRRTRAART